MRRAIPLLLLATLTAAEESFESDLAAFDDARGRFDEPGGPARLDAAIEQLVTRGDARAIEPLARHLVATFAMEAETTRTLKGIEDRGEKARVRLMAVDKDVVNLRRRLESGDRSVEPTLRARIDERTEASRTHAESIEGAAALTRVVRALQLLRPKLATAVARLLSKLEGEALAAQLEALRGTFDLGVREQALYLVNILRDSARPEAAPRLLEVLESPKATMDVRMAAVVAAGRIRTPAVWRALVGVAESDEELRPHALHALSMAAERRLATPADARAWLEKR